MAESTPTKGTFNLATRFKNSACVFAVLLKRAKKPLICMALPFGLKGRMIGLKPNFCVRATKSRTTLAS